MGGLLTGILRYAANNKILLFFQQSECSDEEEDSLFVQFSDANNDLYLAEIREYDTSVSEKVGYESNVN